MKLQLLLCVLSTHSNLKSNWLQLYDLNCTQLQLVKVHRKKKLKKVQLNKNFTLSTSTWFSELVLISWGGGQYFFFLSIYSYGTGYRTPTNNAMDVLLFRAMTSVHSWYRPENVTVSCLIINQYQTTEAILSLLSVF